MPGAYDHTTRHARECAESRFERDVASRRVAGRPRRGDEAGEGCRRGLGRCCAADVLDADDEVAQYCDDGNSKRFEEIRPMRIVIHDDDGSGQDLSPRRHPVSVACMGA
jgi:hypothetical protein